MTVTPLLSVTEVTSLNTLDGEDTLIFFFFFNLLAN